MMKKIVLIYGIIASLVILPISAYFLWLSDETHEGSEWLGYLIMIIGLSMIFVGIKQHRDKNLGGIIGFAKAFQIGFLISLIAGIFYVASWEIVYHSSDQDFIESYQISYIEKMRADGLSETVISEKKQEMEEFASQYENFFFRIVITLLEILPVGLIISLIGALSLKTKKIKR